MVRRHQWRWGRGVERDRMFRTLRDVYGPEKGPPTTTPTPVTRDRSLPQEPQVVLRKTVSTICSLPGVPVKVRRVHTPRMVKRVVDVVRGWAR